MPIVVAAVTMTGSAPSIIFAALPPGVVASAGNAASVFSVGAGDVRNSAGAVIFSNTVNHVTLTSAPVSDGVCDPCPVASQPVSVIQSMLVPRDAYVSFAPDIDVVLSNCSFFALSAGAIKAATTPEAARGFGASLNAASPPPVPHGAPQLVLELFTQMSGGSVNTDALSAAMSETAGVPLTATASGGALVVVAAPLTGGALSDFVRSMGTARVMDVANNATAFIIHDANFTLRNLGLAAVLGQIVDVWAMAALPSADALGAIRALVPGSVLAVASEVRFEINNYDDFPEVTWYCVCAGASPGSVTCTHSWRKQQRYLVR